MSFFTIYVDEYELRVIFVLQPLLELEHYPLLVVRNRTFNIFTATT